jgi:NAD(P)-dependent dehydrogenase (short-subunit alcohol dehydrogenase family)
MSHESRVALVTGGAGGIGTALVRMLANIYRRLGFVEEFESLRFCLEAPSAYPPTSAVPLTVEKLDAIACLERAAFGDDRTRLLRLLFPHAEAGFVVERAGHLAGYLFVTPTTTGVHVGPCLADDSEAAAELWGAALRAARGRPVTVGIGAPNHAGTELLQSLGFRSKPSSVRMVRGPATAGGDIERVFALGSGAFG